MKPETNRHFGKGVRNLCDDARSWCAKLEALSSAAPGAGIPAALARAFAPVLAGSAPPIDLRGLALLLIHAIRELVERLLAEETLLCEILTGLPAARKQRDAAVRKLYQRLRTFRLVDLSSCGGPVVPPGALPRQPEQLADFAAAVRPHLDCERLEAGPWVRIQPSLRPDFDQAVAELTTAVAGVDQAVERSREARKARAATMDALRVHVNAARSLHRALRDLQTLEKGKENPCETR